MNKSQPCDEWDRVGESSQAEGTAEKKALRGQQLDLGLPEAQ